VRGLLCVLVGATLLGCSGATPGGGTGGAGGERSGVAGSGGGTGAGTGGSAGAGGGGSSGAGGNGAPSLTWDFTNDAQGWTGAFADYPMGMETFYELAFGQAALPAEVGLGGGLRLAGNNHSDDLFMFVSHPVDGLRPAAVYDVAMEVVIATNAPADCGGIGGAPGTSVFVKAGAVGRPVSAAPDATGFMVINVDKGNESQGGTEMKVLGDISNTNHCPNQAYQLKTLQLTGVSATTSAGGSLWLVVGTDSGFEGITVLYYDRISVTLTPR
jgi:hypothetical protein